MFNDVFIRGAPAYAPRSKLPQLPNTCETRSSLAIVEMILTMLSRLLAALAVAAASHPNAPLNASLGLFQHEVTAMRDGSTLHLAWSEGFWPGMETLPPPGGPGGAFINHTCAFSTSGDRGASWAPPTLYQHAGMIGVNPVLAAGGGRAYRVCMGVQASLSPPSFGKSGILELSASGDGGATWSPWRTVVSQSGAPNGNNEVDKPWLLADGANVYMSYTRFPPLVASTVGEGSIEVVASHNGGASFGAPVVLGLGQGTFFAQAGAGGALCVSYVHNQVAQIATSLDRGATFEVVAGPQLPANIVFPTLTYLHAQVDGGMALLACSAHYFGPAILYSRPAGRAWSAGSQLAASALNAAMAGSTGGAVDIVWTESTPNSGPGRPGTGPGAPGWGAPLNGTAQTFAVSSTDGGVTLQKRTSVSEAYPAHCGYPDVQGPDGYEVYKGAYQGLVRDDHGALQLFYIHWSLPWGSKIWRAVLAAPCVLSLEQLCAGAKRSSTGNCLVCASQHQQELQRAGCTNADVDSYCSSAW